MSITLVKKGCKTLNFKPVGKITFKYRDENEYTYEDEGGNEYLLDKEDVSLSIIITLENGTRKCLFTYVN